MTVNYHGNIQTFCSSPQKVETTKTTFVTIMLGLHFILSHYISKLRTSWWRCSEFPKSIGGSKSKVTKTGGCDPSQSATHIHLEDCGWNISGDHGVPEITGDDRFLQSHEMGLNKTCGWKMMWVEIMGGSTSSSTIKQSLWYTLINSQYNISSNNRYHPSMINQWHLNNCLHRANWPQRVTCRLAFRQETSNRPCTLFPYGKRWLYWWLPPW